MSDTPRTDAVFAKAHPALNSGPLADFARELERELTMANSRRAQADVIAENKRLRASLEKCVLAQESCAHDLAESDWIEMRRALSDMPPEDHSLRL